MEENEIILFDQIPSYEAVEWTRKMIDISFENDKNAWKKTFCWNFEYKSIPCVNQIVPEEFDSESLNNESW